MPSMIEKMTMTYFHWLLSHLSGPRPLPGFPEFHPWFLFQALWFMPLLEKNVGNIKIKNVHNVTHNQIYNSQENITTGESRSCCQTTNSHKHFDSLELWLLVNATSFGCQRHGSELSSCNEYSLNIQISYL
jgi:hypothetical protein